MIKVPPVPPPAEAQRYIKTAGEGTGGTRDTGVPPVQAAQKLKGFCVF